MFFHVNVSALQLIQKYQETMFRPELHIAKLKSSPIYLSRQADKERAVGAPTSHFHTLSVLHLLAPKEHDSESMTKVMQTPAFYSCIRALSDAAATVWVLFLASIPGAPARKRRAILFLSNVSGCVKAFHATLHAISTEKCSFSSMLFLC